MKKRTPVSSIMSKEVVSVNVTHSLREVDALLKEKSIRHLPVVSGEEIIGMISSTDLARVSFVTNAYETAGHAQSTMYDVLSIEQVMTKNVISVQEHQTIKEVLDLFINNTFHAMPVLEGKKLVGIVTTTDILKFLHEQF